MLSFQRLASNFTGNGLKNGEVFESKHLKTSLIKCRQKYLILDYPLFGESNKSYIFAKKTIFIMLNIHLLNDGKYVSSIELHKYLDMSWKHYSRDVKSG